MSRDQEQDNEPLLSQDQLVEWFEAGNKSPDQRGIGTEHEKFGYDIGTGAPLPWDGPRGVKAMLEGLVERFGWEPFYRDGEIVAMERDGAAVTLEPGGQLELSGAVLKTIQDTERELYGHFHEVSTLAAELGQRWVPTGIHAWDDLDAVEWMPKPRYEIMRRYLPTRGRLAHWMMKMTCTVQANFDYRDLNDAMSMMRLGMLASPLVSAMAAMSPVHLGKPNGMATQRMAVCQETDPDRCGVPPGLLDPDASIEAWIDWVLDVPMFFIDKDGEYVDLSGCSFRDYMKNGHGDYRATMGDFELHVSTVFPEVRLKQFVEVRSSDAGPGQVMLATPAIWKGLYYDDDARGEAFELLGTPSYDELAELYRACRHEGLDGTWMGRDITELSSRLCAIARGGLERIGAGEERYLDALLGASGTLQAPGTQWLKDWHRFGGDRLKMQEAWSIDQDPQLAKLAGLG